MPSPLTPLSAAVVSDAFADHVAQDGLRQFKIAIQAREGGTLDLYTWKARTGVELLVQLKKTYDLNSVTDFKFLEVHEILPNGGVKVMYGDISRSWPDGVTIKKFEGIVRGKPEIEKNNLEKYDVGSKVMETKIDIQTIAEKISEPEKFPNEKDVGIRPLDIRVA